jgi:hypothetical protein
MAMAVGLPTTPIDTPYASLLQCMSPLLARLGRPEMSAQCPLLKLFRK